MFAALTLVVLVLVLLCGSRIWLFSVLKVFVFDDLIVLVRILFVVVVRQGIGGLVFRLGFI